jgi:6-phosphogluconolactonase
MTQETLLGQILGAGPRFFPVPTDVATPADGAARYAETIRRELGASPVFDLVILGVGEDGHTASIFPHAPVIHASGSICAAVEHPEDKKARVTLTPEVLFGARRTIFIVKGEAKAEIMKRVLEGDDSVDTIPSKLYTRAEDRTTFFLDSGAAVRLSRSTVS